MLLKLRRFVASMIDFILIFYFCYYLVELLDIFDNIYYYIFISVVGLDLAYNIFIRKDCIIGYESIGKKIMSLKIYDDNKRILDKNILLKRCKVSISSIFYYPFMILFNNKSKGDKVYHTEVK